TPRTISVRASKSLAGSFQTSSRRPGRDPARPPRPRRGRRPRPIAPGRVPADGVGESSPDAEKAPDPENETRSHYDDIWVESPRDVRRGERPEGRTRPGSGER